jgi:aminoglycoside phosphotransferase (APT) family kinase protein
VTSADQPEGLDLAGLDGYLRSLGIERNGDLRAELISGGRSNLTFRVYDDKADWLVRRPPLHGLTPSAHDMAREYRVVAALQDTPVPVARAIALCEDDSVLGAPFQIVEFVAGQVVRRRAQLEALSHTVIDGCVDALIRVLVDLHGVDPDVVGLGDFGKPSGYLERQVRRWGSQWELVRLPDDHRDADVQRLHTGLRESIPQQSRSSIVHGDYRIDNTILDADDPTRVLAVVDWELSTLGDPLSDAALMCVYRDPALDLIVNAQAAWTSPLLPTADELADRYSLASGWPLAHWEFYMALAYFKLAIIAAGIDFRRRMSDRARGEGEGPEDVAHVPEVVAPLISRGLAELAKLPG